MDSRTLCLGVLMLGDATGYEIKKSFEEGPFAHFHHSGFGSIYPALGKLHDEGLVTCQELAQQGRPAKKVYSITSSGIDALKEAVASQPATDKIRSDTLFMFFFADFLGPGHRRAVYDSYLDHYRRLSEGVRGLDNTGISEGRLFVRGFGLAIYEAVVRYMEEHGDLAVGDGLSAGSEPHSGRGAAE